MVKNVRKELIGDSEGLNKESLKELLSYNMNEFFDSELWEEFRDVWLDRGEIVMLPKDWNEVEWVIVCEVHQDDWDYFSLLEFDCHGDCWAVVVNIENLVV